MAISAIFFLSLLVATTAFQGDMTYYYVDAGHTSCGTLHKNSEAIAAISWLDYIRTPNPNNSPTCKKCALIKSGGRSVLVKIKDKCGGCKSGDIDVSPSVFRQFADLGVGRMKVSWEYVPCSSKGSPRERKPGKNTKKRSPKPKSPPRPNSNYCGRTYAHSKSCRKRCPKGTDKECPRGQRCYTSVSCSKKSKPGARPTKKRKGMPGNYCGRSYTDSLKCRHRCPNGFNEECPAGELCYDSVPC